MLYIRIHMQTDLAKGNSINKTKSFEKLVVRQSLRILPALMVYELIVLFCLVSHCHSCFIQVVRGNLPNCKAKPHP